MNHDIQFFSESDATSVHKTNGTDVSYFIFQEYEIHLNKIAPSAVQEWHYHSRIEETLLITKGELTCYYFKDGVRRSRKLAKNDLVRVGSCSHTFANESDTETEFVVFRFVPDGRDKREIIKNDKKVIE